MLPLKSHLTPWLLLTQILIVSEFACISPLQSAYCLHTCRGVHFIFQFDTHFTNWLLLCVFNQWRIVVMVTFRLFVLLVLCCDQIISFSTCRRRCSLPYSLLSDAYKTKRGVGSKTLVNNKTYMSGGGGVLDVYHATWTCGQVRVGADHATWSSPW